MERQLRGRSASPVAQLTVLLSKKKSPPLVLPHTHTHTHKLLVCLRFTSYLIVTETFCADEVDRHCRLLLLLLNFFSFFFFSFFYDQSHDSLSLKTLCYRDVNLIFFVSAEQNSHFATVLSLKIFFSADFKCFPTEKLLFDIDFQSHRVFLHRSLGLYSSQNL